MTKATDLSMEEGSLLQCSKKSSSQTAAKSPAASSEPADDSAYPPLAIHSAAEGGPLHAELADEAVLLPDSPNPIASYLDVHNIISIAQANRRRRHPPRLRPALREPRPPRRLRPIRP